MAQLPNPDEMDVSDDGYETDATEDTIIGDDGYTSDEVRQINEYYDQMTLTPPRINRNINPLTPSTPPTRLLTNTQIPGQVYKMVIEPDGTLRLVPFTSDDYISGQQPFDIGGNPINLNELPRIQPRRLFDEKEGGAYKSRRKRIRRRSVKKSLRKRRSSRKRKTNKRRKTRSLPKK
jgi:hypothetical protein